MNLPSTKLGNDATFFAGWKRKKRYYRSIGLQLILFVSPVLNKGYGLRIHSLCESCQLLHVAKTCCFS